MARRGSRRRCWRCLDNRGRTDATAESHSSADTMNRSDGDTADVEGQVDSVEVQGGAGGEGRGSGDDSTRNDLSGESH